MAVDLLVGAVVGAGTLYLWGWRRLRNVRVYWQRRKQADAFETALRELRDVQVAATYGPATAADSELLSTIAAHQSGIEACGLAVLGDFVRRVGDRRIGIVRAFYDQARTTFAIATVLVEHPTVSTLTLYSFADDQTFATLRGTAARLAKPPFINRQRLPANVPYAQVIDRHRTFAAASPLVQVASRDELIAELERWNEKVTRWREAQPPDDLLEADLQSVLGDAAFARTGKTWVRRLRGRLPEATLRRG